jgi:fumarate reductase flavoprotein subunit
MRKSVLFVLAVLAFFAAGCAAGAPAVQSAPAPQAPAQAAPAAPPADQIVIEKNPGPGPYTAETMGYHGPVTVTLDVKDRVLTMVTVTGSEETAGIGSRAIDTLGGIMLKANSIAVDAVSGATESSKAVFLAAEKALAKAGLANSDLKR